MDPPACPAQPPAYGPAQPPAYGPAQPPVYGSVPGIAPYQVDPQVVAHWERRVAALLLDLLFLLPGWLLLIVGTAVV